MTKTLVMNDDAPDANTECPACHGGNHPRRARGCELCDGTGAMTFAAACAYEPESYASAIDPWGDR